MDKPHERFRPLTVDDLAKVLELTIKKDDLNKLVTFLCQLSAYTESAQFNISFNAPSSTGKSYIPTEIAKLFPPEDVLEIGYCSPTAFFHDAGDFDKETKTYTVDLSRKILIFLDQPHAQLLERLRPILSHDKKKIMLKITDKNQKHGLRTKNVVVVGYPAVIFCTAGLRIDEQEATRFLLLSPDIDQDKLRFGISETIKKEAEPEIYAEWLKSDPERADLVKRIAAIREAGIQEVTIAAVEDVKERFLNGHRKLKPRHQRDIKRLLSIIKALALLNVWWRDRDGHNIVASQDDIDQAWQLWEKLATSQEHNLPPYVWDLHREVIVPLFDERNAGESAFGEVGISRQEVLNKHYDVYGRMLDPLKFRDEILPMLRTAGLIVEEPDPVDKRRMLIHPVRLDDENNSGEEGGVDGKD